MVALTQKPKLIPTIVVEQCGIMTSVWVTSKMDFKDGQMELTSNGAKFGEKFKELME